MLLKHTTTSTPGQDPGRVLVGKIQGEPPWGERITVAKLAPLLPRFSLPNNTSNTSTPTLALLLLIVALELERATS
jgi:hypothetical protein